MLSEKEIEGWDAYYAGIPLKACPYPVPKGGLGIYVEWKSGWCYARECNEGDWLFPTGRKQPQPKPEVA